MSKKGKTQTEKKGEKTFLAHNKDLHDQITKMSSKKQTKFYTKTIRDVFMLGLAYALKKDLKPVPLKSNKKQQSIRIKEVIHDKHKFILQIIAYWITKDPECVADERLIYEMAEEYANAGLVDLIQNQEILDEGYPSFTLGRLALGE